jgi:hypothetical protein
MKVVPIYSPEHDRSTLQAPPQERAPFMQINTISSVALAASDFNTWLVLMLETFWNFSPAQSSTPAPMFLWTLGGFPIFGLKFD